MVGSHRSALRMPAGLHTLPGTRAFIPHVYRPRGGLSVGPGSDLSCLVAHRRPLAGWRALRIEVSKQESALVGSSRQQAGGRPPGGASGWRRHQVAARAQAPRVPHPWAATSFPPRRTPLEPPWRRARPPPPRAGHALLHGGGANKAASRRRARRGRGVGGKVSAGRHHVLAPEEVQQVDLPDLHLIGGKAVVRGPVGCGEAGWSGWGQVVKCGALVTAAQCAGAYARAAPRQSAAARSAAAARSHARTRRAPISGWRATSIATAASWPSSGTRRVRPTNVAFAQMGDSGSCGRPGSGAGWAACESKDCCSFQCTAPPALAGGVCILRKAPASARCTRPAPLRALSSQPPGSCAASARTSAESPASLASRFCVVWSIGCGARGRVRTGVRRGRRRGA